MCCEASQISRVCILNLTIALASLSSIIIIIIINFQWFNWYAQELRLTKEPWLCASIILSVGLTKIRYMPNSTKVCTSKLQGIYTLWGPWGKTSELLLTVLIPNMHIWYQLGILQELSCLMKSCTQNIAACNRWRIQNESPKSWAHGYIHCICLHVMGKYVSWALCKDQSHTVWMFTCQVNDVSFLCYILVKSSGMPPKTWHTLAS